jgi:hypothetical protein
MTPDDRRWDGGDASRIEALEVENAKLRAISRRNVEHIDFWRGEYLKAEAKIESFSVDAVAERERLRSQVRDLESGNRTLLEWWRFARDQSAGRAAENERLQKREERIVARLGTLLDGGVWPHASAVKVLGGREVILRALVGIDDEQPDPHHGHVAHSIAEPCIPQCPLYREGSPMPVDRTPVIEREHRWSILVCPDCGEERYGYPCWNCKSGKSGERVAVVPVEAVVAAMQERGVTITSTTYRAAAAFVKAFAEGYESLA